MRCAAKAHVAVQSPYPGAKFPHWQWLDCIFDAGKGEVLRETHALAGADLEAGEPVAAGWSEDLVNAREIRLVSPTGRA